MTEYTKALNERFLLQKEYLGENKSVNNITPVVSVTVATYQHVNYIKECLDGILMQKTNFPIEIIIGEDGSTDGAQEICKEYAHAHTDKIRLFIRDRKLSQYKDKDGSIQRFNGLWNRMSCRGKYIAFCEGDDYWTDPLKLQKQVDFLESHPDYVMCSHRFKQYMQKEGIYKDDWYGDISDGIVYDLDTLIHGGWYHHPLTVMFRSDKLDIEEYSQYPYTMDAVLFFHLLKKGPGIMLNEDMAVYRIHSGGVWSGINQENRLKNEFKARIGLYEVEQSYEAAFFLRHQFAKCFGRKWMLQEWKTMMESFKILSKHFGGTNTSKLFLKKLLLNQDLKY